MNTLTSPPTGTRRRPVSRRVLVPLLVVAAVVIGLALWAFQPWRVFTSTTVHEALPGASSTAAPGAVEAELVTLATGSFVTHAHRTTGTVAVVQLADGSRALRLENLDTSDGPDLHVWLSDQPVSSGSAGQGVFDDGAFLDLGSLKGNKATRTTCSRRTPTCGSSPVFPSGAPGSTCPSARRR